MRKTSRTLATGAAVLLTLFGYSAADTPLTTELVTFGLIDPVYVTAAPGDTSRIFIIEQPGRIRIYKNDSLAVTPFLDIDALVTSSGNEQGLLGMAFHPQYNVNGYFYVNYTGNDGSTYIDRFQVSGDPDVADGGSRFTILTVAQPFTNHNAGMLAFSPIDGYLYVGLGDGGSGGDPGNRAQDPTTYLGKMLRIDVDGGSPYAIPADNPYVGAVDTLDEIWHMGLRNPWRYSFDRATGDLYIADVGQNEWEEINFQDASSTGGENWGWRLKEGDSCYNPATNCDPGGVLDDPITTYGHGGSPFKCSITGGFVYRGCAIPDLQGTYFYADYCSGQVWSFRYDGVNLTDSTERTGELGLSGRNITSFGEDALGEQYITDFTNGEVLKIVPDGVASQCNANCCQNRGNVDGVIGGGGPVDVADLSYLVDFLFKAGPPPPCTEEGNVDGIIGVGGPIDVADLSYLVDYLFQGGPPPPAC